MAFKIQRVPQGLANLLACFTGAPSELEERVRGSIELLQMYGLQQRQILNTVNAAQAENTGIVVTPSLTDWLVFFGASYTLTKTATMTALGVSIQMRRSGGAVSIALNAGQGGPFGATETGNFTLPYWAPYPILCPPGTVFIGSLLILGTDATANAQLTLEFGIVG